VTNVRGAVGYLGMETIKNLALASEIFRVFAPNDCIPQGLFESMQLHAHRTAAIAGVLPVDPKIRDLTVLAALLHDVGRLILACKMPDKFCAVLSMTRDQKCEAFQAEEELLGTSHGEMGAYLLGLWGIPNLAVEAIAHHHRPTRIPHNDFDCSLAVYVADLLDHELERHPQDTTGSELRAPDRDCLETLGLLPRLAEFRELAIQSRSQNNESLGLS